MKNIYLFLLLLFSFSLHAQDKVGINIVAPESILDIRSLADDASPDVQLATPSMSHFLRLFSGHNNDPRPYVLFSKSDTFRIASSAVDYSLFAERIAILPNGYIGLNPAQASEVNHPFIAYGDLIDYIFHDGPSSPTGSAAYPVNSGMGAGQTITIETDGRVIGIDINARSLGPGPAKFTYALKENDNNGILLDIGSVDIPNTSFGYVSITNYPIDVTAGQTIFLELTYDSNEDGECNVNDTDPYAGGDAWSYDGNWSANPSDELAFYVWMEVPDTNRVHGISLLGGTAQARLGEIIFPRETGYFGQVLAMSFNGQLEWQDQSGGVFANIGGVVQNTGDHETDDFIFGDYHLTNLSTNIFFFDKDKGAFRTGRVTNSDWQPANLGQFSFASGWNTRAAGYCSQAAGNKTNADGDYSTVMGYFNTVWGDHGLAAGSSNVAGGDNSAVFGLNNGTSGIAAFAAGQDNSANGDQSAALGKLNAAAGDVAFASGQGTKASGKASSSFGYGTIANGFSNTVVGIYNDPIALQPQNFIENNTPLFIVGNGVHNTDRRNAFLVLNDGRVGVGTNVPNTKVHVYGDGATGLKIESVEDDAFLSLENLADDWEIRLDQSEANELDWRYNGSTKMVLSTDGRLALGSETMATGYRLSVSGNIIAEEVRCQLKVDWPDYVFSDSYHLMPLDHIEKSIKKDGHLPGIPAAAVIDEQGLDLGDMQVKMMEKIEELTLHLIEMNKRILQLEEENQGLKRSTSKTQTKNQ